MKRSLVVATVGLFVSMTMLGSPAQANHTPPEIAISDSKDCGVFTASITTNDEAEHSGNSEWLQYRLDGEDIVNVELVGVLKDIPFGPFKIETVLFEWRMWGGGERDYDNPPLDAPLPPSSDSGFDEAIIALQLDSNGLPTVTTPMGWNEVTVSGCVPEEEPTPSPTSEPTLKPSETPEAVAKPTLPQTGSVLPIIAGSGLALIAGGSALFLVTRRRLSV